MSLSCVYTDLDGTLLGQGGSLFRDAEGGFSMAQARALEACHRAGVEVVIMSGRREPQVLEDARLMGQTSYIYEAGCAFAIEGETTLMTGEMVPDERGTVYEQMEARGIPKLLFDHFDGRLEYHSPWHDGRVLSHLFRGKVDVDEANELLVANGFDDLRLLDNGAIGRPMPAIEGRTHAYHLVPKVVSKAARSPPTPAPAATTPPSASASATRSRTSRSRPRSAASSSSPTGPSATPACAPRSAPGTTPRSPRAAWATASTRRSSRRWSSAVSIGRWPTRPSRSRSTWRSCSGSRRPGCR